MKQESLEILRELSSMQGISGFEHEIKDYMRDQLNGLAEFGRDNLGSLICEKKGTAGRPRIMIPAHMDEIGFVVKDIDKSGCLRFAPIGGWLDHVLLGHEVTVQARSFDLPGIIGCCPPHMMPREERKKLIKRKSMFIDIGAADKEDAQKMGVRIGDPVVPRQRFFHLENEKYLAGKAWDDRVGCALVIELLKELKNINHPNTVFGVGTVQEEVGTRGAETSADVVDPDFCVALDVGIATDVPGVENEPDVKLGEGPVLYVIDAGTISHLKFRDYVLDLAGELNIPHQISMIEGGATDARAVQTHSKGVASVVFGIPARYIHSHAGVIHTDDYDAMLALLVEIVRGLDEQVADEILDR